jgi:hypothetical protein
MLDLSLQSTDVNLTRAARRLANETIGEFEGFNTDLCRFKNGRPVISLSKGSRREELLLDLGVLARVPGGVRLNVSVVDGAMRWA